MVRLSKSALVHLFIIDLHLLYSVHMGYTRTYFVQYFVIVPQAAERAMPEYRVARHYVVHRRRVCHDH